MSDFIQTPYALRFSPARLTAAIDWHGHLGFAAWLMELVRPSVLVELGVFRGDSFAAFAQAARELEIPCSLFGIDTWAGDATTGLYGDVYPELKDYFDVHHPSARLMRMRFEEAIADFADGSVDVLHIDGCHHYEAVRQDYEMWRPKLSRRGIILFHDVEVLAEGFGSYQHWREICGDYPSFSFKHSNGLGVLLVGEEQPETLLSLARDAQRCECFRAMHEAIGARFFYLAKMKYWQAETARHAAALSAAQNAAPVVSAPAGHWLRRLLAA